MADQAYGIGRGLCAIRPTAIHPRYLWYAVDLVVAQLRAASQGSTYEAVTLEEVSNATVPTPDLKSQKAIADFLDRETARIDRLIDLRQRMMNLLQERLAAIADSVLWTGTTEPLRHLVDKITVGIVVRPASWYVSAETPGAVAAIRATDVKPFAIRETELVHISAEGNAMYPKSQLSTNDIVVVRTGNAGAAAIVPPTLDGANCISNVIVRCSERLIPAYLEAVLNSKRAQQSIRAESVGAIQQHFGVEAARALQIPAIEIPDQLDRLHTLTVTRRQTDRLVRSISDQETLLKERRQAIITLAVTGHANVTIAA